MNPSNPGFPYLFSLFLAGLGGSLSLNYLARIFPAFSNFSATFLFIGGVAIFLTFAIAKHAPNFPKMFWECEPEAIKIFCFVILTSVVLGSILGWL